MWGTVTWTESGFSVTRKQQNLKCRCVEEDLQKKAAEREEGIELRGKLGVGIKCVGVTVGDEGVVGVGVGEGARLAARQGVLF